MSINKLKALETLMPLGGWSFTKGVVTIHEDGLANGYTVPTQAELDAAIIAVESDAAKQAHYDELDRLDNESAKILIRIREDELLGITPSEDAIASRQTKLTSINEAKEVERAALSALDAQP